MDKIYYLRYRIHDSWEKITAPTPKEMIEAQTYWASVRDQLLEFKGKRFPPTIRFQATTGEQYVTSARWDSPAQTEKLLSHKREKNGDFAYEQFEAKLPTELMRRNKLFLVSRPLSDLNDETKIRTYVIEAFFQLGKHFYNSSLYPDSEPRRVHEKQGFIVCPLRSVRIPQEDIDFARDFLLEHTSIHLLMGATGERISEDGDRHHQTSLFPHRSYS